MKPVPILQYLDHFGRVGQGEEQPVARAPGPVPFKPRTLRAVPDPAPRAPLSLARALREPAAPRAEASPLLRPRAEGSPLSRPRAAPSEAEIEARIAEAYGRGRQDGAVAARLEEAEAVARVVADEQERSMEAQLDFQLNEYALIADQISSGLQDLEQRIASTTARILAPLLIGESAQKVVEALSEDLAKLRVGGSPGLVRIRGPERVLAALRERVAYLSVDIEYVEDSGVEVTIEAEETTIRSALQPWADLIESLTR